MLSVNHHQKECEHANGFFECNSEYTEYKTRMLSAARASDAPPLLPVGFMQALTWAKKKRVESNCPLAQGAATEAGREISEKLQNDLTASSSPEYVIPFLDNPPNIRTMNFHVPSSTVGPHQFKLPSEEVIDSNLVRHKRRKGNSDLNNESTTTTTTPVIEIDRSSSQAGRQQRAKSMMQKMNIEANQIEKGRRRCPVCLVQWTRQFENFPPHMQLPVLTQVEGDKVFCPFADDHKIYQQIMAGKKLTRKLKEQRKYQKRKDKKEQK